jgi:hypothetical protein
MCLIRTQSRCCTPSLKIPMNRNRLSRAPSNFPCPCRKLCLIVDPSDPLAVLFARNMSPWRNSHVKSRIGLVQSKHQWAILYCRFLYPPMVSRYFCSEIAAARYLCFLCVFAPTRRQSHLGFVYLLLCLDTLSIALHTLQTAALFFFLRGFHTSTVTYTPLAVTVLYPWSSTIN